MKSKIKNIIFFFYALKDYLKFNYFELNKIKKANCIFFFPYYHTGGAERVHLNIVKCIENKNCVVIFTHTSATKNFLNQFQEEANCIEINKILNRKNTFVNNILKGKISKTINHSKNCKTIFGCNTSFYYQLLPKISNNIKKIDLFHAFSNQDYREQEVVDSAQHIDIRIVINKNTKKDLLQFYEKHNIQEKYSNRIQTIGNGIEIDNKPFESKNFNEIKIGFVGRWSVEKRPEIFLEIAKKMKLAHPKIQFQMIGTGMKSNIKKINDAGISFLGEVTKKEELLNFYHDLTFLLITSEYEGFPMVMMESMAQGVIPICTNVGGISEHITNDFNGFLIDDENHENIINSFCNQLDKLIKDKSKAFEISKKAFDYAHENFGIEVFNKSYKILFET
ncbi:glycosyltransferase family 4 protein [Flavobacterium sp.]|uniref:glycosyltransferase family 4 protein n=1 Tax=Flavobacterium sp. TaxID=239 RepID=UPI0037501255